MRCSLKRRSCQITKKVFDGVGKPKEYQVKLHVNPNVPPVAQLIRHTLFSLCDNAKKKVEELEWILFK